MRIMIKIVVFICFLYILIQSLEGLIPNRIEARTYRYELNKSLGVQK